ncbi:MAG: redoxin domain-containing protein, partial [Rikenellaceae bacterium]|nr:redoxin domain-containing protein [Rikenellaceae bacterium]
YCTLSGGIYDDQLLAEYLRLDDSVGQVRGSYMRLGMEAFQRKDTATGLEYERNFNLFYENNPGVERASKARNAYKEANPQSSLYLLIDRISSLSYTPTEVAKAAYDAFSPELRASYYGQMYARQMANMERLAKGRPAPDFSLVTTEGKTAARDDYKGSYLLIYHWGMCPGSIYIDGQVRELYGKYKEKGLKMLGLTESVATIRQVYEGLPEDKKTAGPGVDDIRPVLAGMREHPWTEVELETGHPANKEIMEAYNFAGWPFFVLIGPDGSIQARGFTDAFFEAKGILDKELGGEKTE